MKKYGKPIGPLLKHKKDFFEKNNELLKETQRVANIYRKQPLREACKICSETIENYQLRFLKQEVEYRICEKCGQLNGIYEDTEQFARSIYNGEKYAEQYLEENRQKYAQRMKDIYLPKVDFLFEALQEEKENPFELTYADFGAGSGYMVAALNNRESVAATGYEVSSAQVDYAQQMNDSGQFIEVQMNELYEVAKTVEVDVVTMIGVIEHLQYPLDIMKSLFENPYVNYVFCTFPMFSFSVYFELAFPNVMPRHLAMGHTHLFQESSLEYLFWATGFQRNSEWWFGTDIMDLVRSVEIRVRQLSEDPKTTNAWREMFDKLVDELQMVLDRHQVASQVHMLLDKK